MKKIFFKFLLQTVWGFQFETLYPKEVKKAVLIMIPHTSNWDFPIGILLRPIIDLDSYFVAKNSLFWFPLGNILRWMGGVAVDRSKHNNFVDSVAALFQGRESFKITMTPEGTRSKVTTLKSGFYYVAMKAQMPVVGVKFDFGTMKIGFSQPFYPTGDYEKDLPHMLEYFKGVVGKNNEQAFNIEAFLSKLNSKNNLI